MNNQIQISVSIVVYHENKEVLDQAVKCFLEIPMSKNLFIIDNSSSSDLLERYNHEEITYIYVGENIGFGAGHNLIIDKIATTSQFHVVLNPDIVFKPQVVPNLIDELQKRTQVSMIAPQVLYPDGSLQYTCRKQPRLRELLFRRLGVYKTFTHAQEYRNSGLLEPFNPEFVHGCFMLFKTNEFVKMKGFDTRYFLYMEDADICREIKKKGNEILYYPKEQVIHFHRKGSSKKIRLLYHHIVSALKYFKKWS